MKLLIFVLIFFLVFVQPCNAQILDSAAEIELLKGILDTITPRTECVADYINLQKKTMITVGIDSVAPGDGGATLTMNEVCRALTQNMEVGGSGLTNIGHQNDVNVMVATRALISFPGFGINSMSGTTSERPLTAAELKQFSCLFPGGVNVAGLPAALDAIASILPSSPEAIRIPTIINNLLNEGSLVANLAIELYSAVWQFLAVLTTFKMIKLGLGR